MAHARVAHAAAPCVTPLALVDVEPDPHWVERAQTAPRGQGSGRPQRVVVLDENCGDLAVLMIEFVEVVGQCPSRARSLLLGRQSRSGLDHPGAPRALGQDETPCWRDTNYGIIGCAG